METIIAENTYFIPFHRWVDLKLTDSDYDKLKPVFVRIKSPKGFEDVILETTIKKKIQQVAVHKRINGKMLHPVNEVELEVFQIIDETPVPKKVTSDKISLNPEPLPSEEKKGIIQTVLSGTLRPKDWKAHAIEQTEKRKARLAKVTNEVNQSSALKPVGLDGKKILTGDDCDYSRGAGLIENLIRLEERHNAQSGLMSASEKKLLCEYYDVIAFSGIEIVIGLYIALGAKSKGKGNLGYLAKWYQEELSKIYSPTSLGEMQKKGKKVLNGLKPKHLRKSPNPGLSIKQAAKIIGELFIDEFTGKPLRAKDLQCEIYQPIFFDDEQTRVYSMHETPNAKLVDIAINTGLDPLYFQSKKMELGSISLGPTRRSFDLPLAQHNDRITIVSIGAALIYQESEDDMEGANPAQLAFLHKKKSYRLDYLDTIKYMEDHTSSVNYLRIETGQLFGVRANSIAIKDLEASINSTDRSTFWSNGQKNEIEWS